MNGQSLACASSNSRAACRNARAFRPVAVWNFLRQLGHALLRDLQVRINPFVLFVQPRAPVTFLAPARRAGRGDLIGRMAVQIFARRDERKDLLVVKSFAREVIQKLRPFIPPMAEQFRVVGRDDDRRAVQEAGDALRLFDALIEKMPGVFARRLQREVALVNLLVRRPRR